MFPGSSEGLCFAPKFWADRSEMTPEEAIRIARESKPATPITPGARDLNGREPGMRVRVVPDDYGFDPVEGEVVALEIHGIAIRREAADVGEGVVHFPRAGFRVSKL